ncbi:hypothetical protein Hanom_Chr07g00640031 [Helianthus anomalus]
MVKIRSLPKYRYVVSNADVEQPDVSACRMILMWTHGQYFSTECVFLIEMRYCNFGHGSKWLCFILNGSNRKGKNHGLLYINGWNVCPTWQRRFLDELDLWRGSYADSLMHNT